MKDRLIPIMYIIYYSEIVDNIFLVTTLLATPITVIFLCISGLNPCAVNNSDCSHLCLLSSVKSDGYSCACATDFILHPDGKSCDAGWFWVLNFLYF